MKVISSIWQTKLSISSGWRSSQEGGVWYLRQAVFSYVLHKRTQANTPKLVFSRLVIKNFSKTNHSCTESDNQIWQAAYMIIANSSEMRDNAILHLYRSWWSWKTNARVWHMWQENDRKHKCPQEAQAATLGLAILNTLCFNISLFFKSISKFIIVASR